MARTHITATIEGVHIELTADAEGAAHITARALSACHPAVPVGIWRGMTRTAAYLDGQQVFNHTAALLRATLCTSANIQCELATADAAGPFCAFVAHHPV